MNNTSPIKASRTKFLSTCFMLAVLLFSCYPRSRYYKNRYPAGFTRVAEYRCDISIEYYRRFELIEVITKDSTQLCTVFIWSSVSSEKRDTCFSISQEQRNTLHNFEKMILSDTITYNILPESGRSARYFFKRDTSIDSLSSRNLYSLARALGLPYE